MIRIATDNEKDQRTVETRPGLAEWLLSWWQTPLPEKFSKFGRPRQERRMQLIEVLPLGAKRQLILVLCDGKQFLVGTGSDSVHLIAELSDGPAVNAGLLPSSQPYAKKLQAVTRVATQNNEFSL